MSDTKTNQPTDAQEVGIDLEQDDVIYDDGASTPDQIKKLREKLKKCVEEKQEYLDGWQRAQADVVNSKKQFEEGRKSIIEYATENIITDILPVLDSFDMAFKDKEAWEKAPENWRLGVEYIYNQLTSTLESHGVRSDTPEGQKFDPQKHDSIELIAVEDKKQDEIILEVNQKGYLLKDRVIRPARVKVGEYSE